MDDPPTRISPVVYLLGIIITVMIGPIVVWYVTERYTPQPTATAPLPTKPTTQNPEQAILEKYQEFGGINAFGDMRSPITPFPGTDGYYQHYTNGSIYWSPTTGAHWVLGAIQAKWRSPVEPHRLGFPTSEEQFTVDAGGRYQNFEAGMICWSQKYGAFIIVGAILRAWVAQGQDSGPLGYPISDEEAASGEWQRQSRFENGVIRWSPERGTATFLNGQ